MNVASVYPSMEAKKVILAGGTGFMGSHLQRFFLDMNWEVVVLTRGKNAEKDGVKFVHWDAKEAGEWASELEGAESVICLAGRSVDCEYTEENKRLIVESRVNSVKALNAAILQCKVPPKSHLLSASATIYGDNYLPQSENSPLADSFSPEVCKAWEGAFFEADLPQTRQVCYRVGFVLGKEGGALASLARLARRGLGGQISHGKMYISWLHIHDLCRIFLRGIETEEMEGVYNATGPTPVTNRKFMKEVRKAVRGPWSPPVPEWAVRFGAKYLLKTAPELALWSRRVIPARLLSEGFSYHFNRLEKALGEIYASPN